MILCLNTRKEVRSGSFVFPRARAGAQDGLLVLKYIIRVRRSLAAELYRGSRFAFLLEVGSAMPPSRPRALCFLSDILVFPIRATTVEGPKSCGKKEGSDHRINLNDKTHVCLSNLLPEGLFLKNGAGFLSQLYLISFVFIEQTMLFRSSARLKRTYLIFCACSGSREAEK